jgi:serine/threonine protein kinase
MSDLHALNLEPGDIVGGYTLISRLGTGAMGSVWRVVDGGGTSYAMKILRDSLDDEDAASQHAQATARERLRREAMALKRIKDPGVCSIVDMEIDDALAFIVTELIEGKNLREDVMQNGRYVGEDLERLASKLIDAVRAVHAAGIVHRDIKPTNVMISVTGPVLVDFGIAMGEGESHVTSTGLVMGTPGFIAPEIIEGVEANDATDWWSTASVLAFAATGAPVFGTQPMMAVLQREAAGNANLQGLPPRTLQAFRVALDPNPRQRRNCSRPSKRTHGRHRSRCPLLIPPLP